jgi:hypothetical protein
MGGVLRFLSVVSFFWMLSSIYGTAHASSAWVHSSNFSSAARFQSDLIQIQQHPQKDFSQHSFSGDGQVGYCSSTTYSVVLVEGVLLNQESTLKRPKIYLLFRTGLSPPHSSIS